MKNTLVASLILIAPMFVSAEASNGLLKACKAECPSAKTEVEADNCVMKLIEDKKTNAKFKASKCFKAHEEHEAHEEKAHHGHSH